MKQTPSLGPRSISDRAHGQIIDSHAAVILGETTGQRVSAQVRARTLLHENTMLLRLLGALLERTGPVELDTRLTDPTSTTLFEIQRFESTDGLTNRWVSKRVNG